MMMKERRKKMMEYKCSRTFLFKVKKNHKKILLLVPAAENKKIVKKNTKKNMFLNMIPINKKHNRNKNNRIIKLILFLMLKV